MKLRGSSQPMPVFHNLEFDFAPTPGLEFDVEVAQNLAEQVAQHDGGRYNHSHASSFQRIRVGVDGLSEPFAADEDEQGYTKNMLLPAHTLDDPNPVFALQIQRALDEREHSNRMNIPATIGMFAVVTATPGGMSAAIMAEKGLTSEEALASAGIGVAFNVLALGGYHSFRNAYRRIVTDEGKSHIHKMHLERAAKFTEKLGLPPVISVK